MSTTKTELHLTCCHCPHVNIVIADRETGVHGHFACGADEADRIADELKALAAEARKKTAARLNIGHA